MDKLGTLVKLMGETVSNQARLRHVLGEAHLLDAAARTLAIRTVAETAAESAAHARALHRFTLDLRDLTLDQERLIGELNHHGRHRLSDRKIAALAGVHNFHIRRADGTTAAERFFGRTHPALFEQLLLRVPLPPRPRRRRPRPPKLPYLMPVAA